MVILVGINFWLPFKSSRKRPADMDASDRIECLQGTRVAMIQFIIGWALDPAGQKNILWLHRLAGASKSTLSTITNRLCEMGRLGAFVFFDQDVIERSNPVTVIRTLAYQVGSFHIHAGRAISTAIKKFPSVYTSPLSTQFRKPLIEPLSSVIDANTTLVLILDRFDECGSAKKREILLEILAEQSFLPPQFESLSPATWSTILVACLNVNNMFWTESWTPRLVPTSHSILSTVPDDACAIQDKRSIAGC